jgi:hypothetical protein
MRIKKSVIGIWDKLYGRLKNKAPVTPDISEADPRIAENPGLFDKLQGIVARELGPNYVNIRPYHTMEAGTRALFLADWGKGESRTVRMVKIDAVPKNSTAERHVRRGCNTAHEVEVSSRFDPAQALANNVVPVIDYKTCQDEGASYTISAEPYLSGYKSLARVVTSRSSSLDTRKCNNVLGA